MFTECRSRGISELEVGRRSMNCCDNVHDRQRRRQQEERVTLNRRLQTRRTVAPSVEVLSPFVVRSFTDVVKPRLQKCFAVARFTHEVKDNLALKIRQVRRRPAQRFYLGEAVIKQESFHQSVSISDSRCLPVCRPKVCTIVALWQTFRQRMLALIEPRMLSGFRTLRAEVSQCFE
jgi:hypothetical protein